MNPAQPSFAGQVVRDGEEQVIASADVCRGDVVVLTTGDIVPADCRLITADELKVGAEPEDGIGASASQVYIVAIRRF